MSEALPEGVERDDALGIYFASCRCGWSAGAASIGKAGANPVGALGLLSLHVCRYSTNTMYSNRTSDSTTPQKAQGKAARKPRR